MSSPIAPLEQEVLVPRRPIDVKSGLDLRKERSMTMEHFKKKFLDTKMKKFETKSRRSKNTPSNEDAQVRSWLKIVCSEVFWVEAGFKPTSS